jgi:hypothetical protein
MKIEHIEHYNFIVTVSHAIEKAIGDIQKEVVVFRKDGIFNISIKELASMYKKAAEFTLISNKKIEEKTNKHINIWDDKETSDLLVKTCIANLSPSIFTDIIDNHLKLGLGKDYLPSKVNIFNSGSIFSIDFCKKNNTWNEENPEGFIEKEVSIRLFIGCDENIVYLYPERL